MCWYLRLIEPERVGHFGWWRRGWSQKNAPNEILTPERIRIIIEETLERMRSGAGGELRERRAALEARIENLSSRLSRLAVAIADGSMALEDVSQFSAPRREQRDAAREELAALPEPKPISTVDDVNPEAFRRHVLEVWRSKEIQVRRKALARIADRIELSPGKATVYYSWKPEPGNYAYHAPYGPLSGSWGQYRLVVEAVPIRRPRNRR